MRLLLIGCAALALVSCQKASAPARNQAAASAPAVPAKGVDRTHKGMTAPHVTLDNGKPFDADLADSGKAPTLVNLWATWCAPCVKELPTIDKLAKDHQARGDLGVMAISQDSGPHTSVEAFLNNLNVKHVGTLQDSKMALSGALDAEVLPTTILYDSNGREVWRYVGDLDWTGPEAAKLLSEGGVGASH